MGPDLRVSCLLPDHAQKKTQPKDWLLGEKVKPPLKTSGAEAKGVGRALGSTVGAHRDGGDGACRTAARLRQICQELGISWRENRTDPREENVGFEMHPQEGTVPTTLRADDDLHHVPTDTRDIQGLIQLLGEHTQGGKVLVSTRGAAAEPCGWSLRLVPEVSPCSCSLWCLCTSCSKPRRCSDTKTGWPQEVRVQGWSSPAPEAPSVRGGSSVSPLNSLPELVCFYRGPSSLPLYM